MSRFFKCAIAAVCTIALVGCGSASESPAESSAPAESPAAAGESAGTTTDLSDLTIAYSVQTLSNQYFVTVSDGFVKYADELGIETIVTDGKQDANAQVSQVEDFIAQQVDAIVISPVNDKALEDVVKQAEDAGIVVVAANQDFPGSQAFVTIPEYDMGRALGDQTGKWLYETYGDEEVQVLVLDYPEIESIIARGDGIREGIMENDPNAVIVQSISANTPEKGSAAMETAFQKYPDIKAVAGVNDAGVLGAYEVVMASGKDLTNFYMGGIDSTDQALQLIADDTIYRTTIDINPKGTGKIIIDTVLDVLENGPKEDPVTIDLNVVTIDNVDEFLN
jgi:ribose transport system substrate-binding protein